MHHEPVQAKLFTKWSIPLLALMLAGAAAFVARFAFGLGATTNLSNNYPWGLWIVFDLIWIALAGGAFVTAGIVYVFHGEKYHVLARPAVWMGLLSYSFVVVTLLADLGLPWHFWQLAVQMPEHSAMYEVSWCVGLYVTVLALEFAPTVFERFGWNRLRDIWRTWSPVYTVAALGLFTFLMSHQIWMAAVATVLFAVIAWLTRPSADRTGVPVILIIAAVTFSTMHQSSLGSLFLLMPDKLHPLWWSPFLSILFFLSAIASGIALVMLMDMTVSRVFRRPWNGEVLAGMGRILLGALVVYYAARIADVAARGQLAALSGRPGALFLIEVLGGGLVPVLLLSTDALRRKKAPLISAALLAMLGVMFHRVNVVLLGMRLPGTMPGGPTETYYPSLVEWLVSLSLVAAAIFFFGLGAKLLPILPRLEPTAERAAGASDAATRG